MKGSNDTCKTALYILEGSEPGSIPIVPNRKWDIWMNLPLLEAAGIHIPKQLLQKAKRVHEPCDCGDSSGSSAVASGPYSGQRACSSAPHPSS
jgi:hypothetical protein